MPEPTIPELIADLRETENTASGPLQYWRTEERKVPGYPGGVMYEGLITPEGGGNVIAVVHMAGPSGIHNSREEIEAEGRRLVAAANAAPRLATDPP